MTRYVMVVIVAICCGESTADERLFRQTPNYIDIGGATSVMPLPISADDFTPTDNWRLSAANLQGAWRDDVETIPPGTTTRSFRIQFYEDTGGLPDDPPFEDFSVVASIGNPQSYFGRTIYDIHVDFPTDLLFSQGTRYWFAAVDEGPGRSGSNGFFWSNSTASNVSAQKGDEGWNLFVGDLGFSLIGTVVPEPYSGTLAGIAGILGSIWIAAVGRPSRD